MNLKNSYLLLIDYISKNSDHNIDPGLNGRSAISLFMFEFYRLTSDVEAYNKGIELIENELNEIHKIKNASLYNGLCGIGWSVQYLSKENLINLDADTFLPQLMEKQLKKIITTKINFTDYVQLDLNNDILFYFAYRFLNTKKKRLKNDYQNILNQILIIYNHQFYQIESYKYYLNLPFQILFPFIKSLLYLIEIDFISPLIPSLLEKIMNFTKEKINKDISEFQLINLKKAFKYLNKPKSVIFISSLINNKKLINNETRDYSTIINVGVWNNGFVQKNFNNLENVKKDLAFKYILELN